MKLTPDQEVALTAINKFILAPEEKVFVLQGYSGTGKSSTLKVVLDRLPSLIKMTKLVKPDTQEYEIQLTATTNKAAENLESITGRSTSTIHSFLSLRVINDYKNNTSKLLQANKDLIHNTILFIDEASYIDSDLLKIIFSKVGNSKVIFIGDPAQLVPIKAVDAPVFKAGFPGVMLSKVVRQSKDNPITTLSTRFRKTVNSGKFFQFKPDGVNVQYLNRDAFTQLAIDKANKSNWKYTDSKVLTWTNKAAISANNTIRAAIQGTHHFTEGEYAICNSFITPIKGISFKTDQLVMITEISTDALNHDVPGNYFTLNTKNNYQIFMPKTIEMRNHRIKRARKEEDYSTVREIESSWIDLRAVYAQTVNKSQGSTYDEVFIDLDDIGKCNNGNTIARMMYVAVSRARNTVYLTGDLY